MVFYKGIGYIGGIKKSTRPIIVGSSELLLLSILLLNGPFPRSRSDLASFKSMVDYVFAPRYFRANSFGVCCVEEPVWCVMQIKVCRIMAA